MCYEIGISKDVIDRIIIPEKADRVIMNNCSRKKCVKNFCSFLI
jgi:hypothetical protein